VQGGRHHRRHDPVEEALDHRLQDSGAGEERVDPLDPLAAVDSVEPELGDTVIDGEASRTGESPEHVPERPGRVYEDVIGDVVTVREGPATPVPLRGPGSPVAGPRSGGPDRREVLEADDLLEAAARAVVPGEDLLRGGMHEHVVPCARVTVSPALRARA